MIDTLVYMAEQLIPEDNPQDDTDPHKNIRRLTEQPIETIDDRDFSQDEVRQIIEGFNPRKVAPGPDGITSNILTLVFKSIPKTVTNMQRMFEEMVLPQRMENSQDNSNYQTWQRGQPGPL